MKTKSTLAEVVCVRPGDRHFLRLFHHYLLETAAQGGFPELNMGLRLCTQLCYALFQKVPYPPGGYVSPLLCQWPQDSSDAKHLLLSEVLLILPCALLSSLSRHPSKKTGLL